MHSQAGRRTVNAMASTYALLIFCILAGTSYAALPLPNYVKPCARNKPDFNECALQRAKETIPHIIKGDRKYKIPPIDPLEVLEIAVGNNGPQQAGIAITLRNCKFYGPGNTEMKAVNMDFNKKKLHLDLVFPRIEVIGSYEISGRVLLLPITGKGPVNVTLVESKVAFDTDFTIEKKGKDEFVIFKNSHITKMEPSRAYFKLDNLFNGDKLLGPEMNNILNINWRESFQELSPPVIEAISQIIGTIINNISGSVPASIAFPVDLP